MTSSRLLRKKLERSSYEDGMERETVEGSLGCRGGLSRRIAIGRFSGAGGFSPDVKQARFEGAAAVELNPIHAATTIINLPLCNRLKVPLRFRTSSVNTRKGDEQDEQSLGGGSPL